MAERVRVPGTACEPGAPALQFRRMRSLLDGCRWVKQAPRACSYPAPRGVVMSGLSPARIPPLGDGIARWPTGLVLRLVRPGLKRKKHP